MPNIHLRALEMKDAEFMLEWMHDSDVVRYLRTDFSHKKQRRLVHTLQTVFEELEAYQKLHFLL